MRLLIRGGPSRRLEMVTALMAWSWLVAPLNAAAAAPRVIWLVRDLRSDTVLARESPDRFDIPIAPGSVMKVAIVAAALESGVIAAGTPIGCTRETQVDGHALRCTHPDLHRPLRAADALAHSCNVFVTTIASRVPRAALDRVLHDLGLPYGAAAAPLPAIALGLEGIRVSPRQLADMMSRVAAEPSSLRWKPATLAVVRDGLRQAARTGTASAFAARRVDAMAKTGTAATGGVAHGIVAGVAFGPAPVSFVLVVSGGAGENAAGLAAERLAALTTPSPLVAPAAAPAPGRAPPAPPVLRVGIPNAAGRYDVRDVALEDYVAGVVTGEAAPDSSRVALDVLATTVRTFALANRARHHEDGFDVCSLTHCQVYRRPTAAAIAAAAATSGQVLLDATGAPASVFYSASCGGRSARPSEVWRDAPDPRFLPSQIDDACGHEPAWQTDLSARDVMRAVRTGGVQGDVVRGLRIVARTPSDRVARLQLDGLVPREIAGEEFRLLVGRTLGWNQLKSNAYDVQQTAAGFRFIGRGAGHGVGLCVVGSVRRAVRGETAATILAHYFPGVTVGTWPSGGVAGGRPFPSGSPVVVIVPQEDRPHESRLRTRVTRLRDELVATLRLAPPDRLTLRFHPTVESYQRATGRQWFTAGATTAGEAHFTPLAALEARGLLDDTIRHEIVHLLTASVYRGRPVWVHEGAAVYFGSAPGSRATRADRAVAVAPRSLTRASCPSDAELVHPASRDALRDAYAHAARCFADQIAAGRHWQDVR